MPNPPLEFFLTTDAPCTKGYCPWYNCIGETNGCPVDGRHAKICRQCNYPRPCESVWDPEAQDYVNPLSERAKELRGFK